MAEDLAHIGRVADIVGLSLRTIRYYEEVGLVTPSGRTSGGFRLYNGEDIDHLLLIKRMKPLGYSLEEMAQLLTLIGALGGGDAETLSPQDALTQLHAYAEAVQDRIQNLKRQTEYAQEFRDRILTEIAHRTRSGEQPVP